MNRKNSAITIVIPCYNEAGRLDVDAFRRYAASRTDVRLLFVDDGSTDDTAEVLQRLCESTGGDGRGLGVISLERNCGKAEAVRRGFLAAFESNPQPEFVGFWDADLATPLEDIALFRDTLEEKPTLLAVFGSRVNLLGREVHRNLLRHYVGRVFATAAAAVLRLPIYDTQCGAKLFRATDDVQAVFAQPFLSSWIFDVEIIARLGLRYNGADGRAHVRDLIFEEPLMIWRDVKGSKIRLRHFVVVGMDLLRIWFRYVVKRGGRREKM